ncbi:16S rRNA (uracil1498-N3)-methyltransferase [Paenibacillus sophorae]|uniref:Ribosomal RNA small subunit methyltransferase E n=1 Tax=Paenibacillus sophorae TaxID=1333845 RepID=A0A1H8RA33_9BACL|nr:RsmE family RNA methyltransferase [Paenibacillus sophorae]QWU15003.1 16S rRNA (uracil(1498)-N(3))-methyltransferase [Paenibacillus sophorae]SEO63157.1 16S rRNA (uracil1498-N3)-methyltransferase [Paenibacillus sophorae]
MQRYFVSPENFGEGSVSIGGEDARHIARVMRGKAGDKLIVSDGVSREALAEIALIGEGIVTVSIIENMPMTQEPRVKITVAQSLPKGDKMEIVIQKCTEIGAAAFLPFLSERTIVQYDERKESKRLERWRKIAKEAAEQAHRNIVPEVAAPLTWKQLLKTVNRYDAVYFCYEKEEGLQLRSAVAPWAAQLGATAEASALVIVGPEGGFSENECREAEEAGAVSVGLGKRILRCETAGMVAAACILYETGEMGEA